MIRIERQPWQEMVAHAEAAYPDECVGIMLGTSTSTGTGAGGVKTVTEAARMENIHDGPKAARYELGQKALLAADAQARSRHLDLIGIYHSHPDCDAYFSETDLKNSCPWYSFVVISIQKKKFHHAHSWLPDPDQTAAEKEELEYGGA